MRPEQMLGTYTRPPSCPPSLSPSLSPSLPPYPRDPRCADVVADGREGGRFALLLDKHVDGPRKLLDELVVELVLRVPGAREGGREGWREGWREGGRGGGA